MTRLLVVPATVPAEQRERFLANLEQATFGTGKLFLFAGDQKVEHLNQDFFGAGISPESQNPEHLFKIAAQSRVGVFATQLGLVARYGLQYKNTRYLIKINAKTNIIPLGDRDPVAAQWTTVDQVAAFRQQSGLGIVGVGMTVYLGSTSEASMLAQAAQMVLQAHQYGMLAVVWIYPRGKAVAHERSIDMIAGATGVAVCLGADFVKVNPPEMRVGQSAALLLQRAVAAAGNTGVICSGGSKRDARAFLEELHAAVTVGGCAGAAIGRNIHQRSFPEAVAFCAAVAAIILDGSDVATACAKLDIKD